jgi:hypothetical protein
MAAKQTTKASHTAKAPKVETKATPATSAADDAAKIAELLKKLGSESSPLIKKRLRRQLRALGHEGGLGKRKAK